MKARSSLTSMLALVGCVTSVDGSPLGTFGDDAPGLAEGDDEGGTGSTSGSTGAAATGGANDGGDAGSTSDAADGDTSGAANESGGDTSTGVPGDGDGGGTAGDDDTVVQNHSGACEDVIWCTDDMDMVSGAHGYAECFVDVAIAPPFSVTAVRYRIGASQHDPVAMTLLVRAWTGTAPGAVLATQALAAADALAGEHAIALDEPVALDVASFCVSVEGDGFGVSRDPSNPVPDVSFMQSADCGPTAYATLQSVGFPGNLCMSATVASGG